MREDAAAPATTPEAQAGWLISQLWRHPVVDVHAVERVGQVADVVIDAAARRIVGVRVARETQEHPLVEAARRTLTGSAGATYVSAAQIIALHEDVVTIDPQRAPETGERPEAFPHLSQVLGFAVLTLAGKRLGRLVDIRVDDEGRNILSYLVQPGGHGVARSDVSLRPQRLFAWHQAQANGGEGGGPPAGHPSGSEPAMLAIPATREVRIGRDLIILADLDDGERAGAAPIARAPEPPAPEA